MADERLYAPSSEFLLAAPNYAADPLDPTAAEIIAAIADGTAAIMTCALNQDGTEFNLDDSDTDDSLSFCQVAGAEEPTFYNATVVYEAFRSFDELDANQATTAFEWLAWPDIEYYAILRVGPEPGEAFAAGDRLKIVRVKTDLPVDVFGSGENVRISNSFLFQGDIAWNIEIS